jgi:CBS domain-containing protein
VHMTTEVITTSEDESVYAAMDKMTNERSRHLPVVREQSPPFVFPIRTKRALLYARFNLSQPR